MTDTTGYEDLSAVLIDAFKQATEGKGRDRHARGAPFDRQPIHEICRMLRGPPGAMFQALKTPQEASGMIERGDYPAADRELLGAIVYVAAAVKITREMAVHAAYATLDEGLAAASDDGAGLHG